MENFDAGVKKTTARENRENNKRHQRAPGSSTTSSPCGPDRLFTRGGSYLDRVAEVRVVVEVILDVDVDARDKDGDGEKEDEPPAVHEEPRVPEEYARSTQCACVREVCVRV